MELQFELLNEKNAVDLVTFLTSCRWPFHGDPEPKKESILERIEKGWYEDNRHTFWVIEDGKRIGLVIIYDINDSIPLFDIRIREDIRGRGFGAQSVKWLTDYVFNMEPSKIRLEAHTRSDNYAMRKTLHKCGFVKEGYLRYSWENDDGTIHDAITYSIIRPDWENELRTPIRLDDLAY
ncbi:MULTISPECIES: GNAT family N-acetyltransferase [Bacillus]|uniref:GNAT family N-acetyltransferase n=1 Tax=Bacillus TaxID=1386 RepID=UPI000BB7A8B5|nr:MULTISPECIES: GNAT family protein [Bacillus]